MLALTGMIKRSEEKSAARISLFKLFTKVAESFNFNQYKNLEYFMGDNDYDDICLTMKLEPSACKETLELFGE